MDITEVINKNNIELLPATESKREKPNFGEGNYILSNIHVGDTRLTSCCEYQDKILCAGFSGELFIINKSDHSIASPIKLSNTIIRCLRVLEGTSYLYLTTDGSEVILFNLNTSSIDYYEHSDSPVYILEFIDDATFVTGERNGNIYLWKYLENVGIFRTQKLFSMPGVVFSLKVSNARLIVVDSYGNKATYNFKNHTNKQISIADCNVFCLCLGDYDQYFGLSNGKIIFDSPDAERVYLESHKDAVRALAISPNEHWLFSASKDRTIRAWHNNQPELICIVKDYLYDMCISKNQQHLYAVDGAGDITDIEFKDNIDTLSSLIASC